VSPLLADYKRSLKLVEVEELFDLVLYRPVAFLFVKLIARTNVTPNQLTLASMIFGVMGGIAFARGTPDAYVAGAALYLVYNILDCSDGQLARVKNSGSRIGRVLDGIADYVATIAAFVGIGVGFANSSEHPLLMWGLTAFAGISNAVQSGLLDYYRTRFLDVVLQRPSVLDTGVEEFRNEYARLKLSREKLFDRAVIRIYLGYSSLQGGLANKAPAEAAPKVDPKAYYARNRVLMHCWT
jgi:hypothetical protein